MSVSWNDKNSSDGSNWTPAGLYEARQWPIGSEVYVIGNKCEVLDHFSQYQVIVQYRSKKTIAPVSLLGHPPEPEIEVDFEPENVELMQIRVSPDHRVNPYKAPLIKQAEVYIRPPIQRKEKPKAVKPPAAQLGFDFDLPNKLPW